MRSREIEEETQEELRNKLKTQLTIYDPDDVKVLNLADIPINSDLTDQQIEATKAVVFKYSKAFAPTSKSIGRADFINHPIYTGDEAPIKMNYFRMGHSEKQRLKAQVDKLMDMNLIKWSSSPWAARALLVLKKDGSDRIVVDYRKLNAVTKKDVYPLPRIDDILDSLGKAKYFTTIDITNAYWHVPMHEDSTEKTAFITPFGLFEWVVMPNGLTNAPATYQRAMNFALRDLIGSCCFVYLHDIIITSNTFEEHLEHLGLVLTQIQNHQLFANPAKCNLAMTFVTLLGHVAQT